VALVRGLRRSSTWFASRRRAFCASSSHEGRPGWSPAGSAAVWSADRFRRTRRPAARHCAAPRYGRAGAYCGARRVRTWTHCSSTRTTSRTTRVGCALSLELFSQVRGGAASGNRTPDLLITSEPLWPTELRRRCCSAVVASVTSVRTSHLAGLLALQRAGQRLDGDPWLDVELQRLAAAQNRLQHP
jgi:hypothetical protein